MDRMPEVHRLLSLSGSSEILSRDVSIEELIQQMDQSGTDIVLLSAWCRPEGWVIDNDEIAEICNKFPKRFKGLATVHLTDPTKAVRELERAVTKLGFVGLRIVPWLWNLAPNDRFYFPLYTKCIELGIPFCTQVGHTGPLKPSETGRPIPYVDEVALLFPDLKIVCGHIGYPWTEEMIAVAWKHENVFIDTSAYKPNAYPSALLDYMKGFGRKKVLFGTNYPQLNHVECARQLSKLNLPDPVLRYFGHKNAERIFRLESK
ncbi:amidohydrolase [Leptospira perolatii]|uniref:Amidohydrolase n=2 Tax=Leptospira perolatii TaxID=2023191 RepID=A0A2M9ZLJ8_9LEPT|nr:amidohydrolase [Leptospira perolatii]PJZ72938.1 amidohydrolase [Leptospira perolatii]